MSNKIKGLVIILLIITALSYSVHTYLKYKAPKSLAIKPPVKAGNQGVDQEKKITEMRDQLLKEIILSDDQKKKIDELREKMRSTSIKENMQAMGDVLTPEQLEKIKEILKPFIEESLQQAKKTMAPEEYQKLEQNFQDRMATLSNGELTSAYIDATDSSENIIIRKNVSRVKADLRSIHTGMEAYRVDWNIYPQKLNLLTKPVAYLSSIPYDVFNNDSEPIKIKMRDDNKYVIYSIGPDKTDDNAEIEYDPTNGFESSGDIFRVIE